jgi:hypothetical protein
LFPVGTGYQAPVRGTALGQATSPAGGEYFLQRRFILCDRNAMSGY